MIPTAVLVTRGDDGVDLAPCFNTIPSEWPAVVWNNGDGTLLNRIGDVLADDLPDYKVYGHFAALEYIETDYAYCQDDDAVCPAAQLLHTWDEDLHRDLILLNEADEQTPWISWGGIFHRDLPAKAISRFVDAYGMSDDVLFWCDLIFSQLTPWVNVDLGWENLPHFRAENRMVIRPDHYTEQDRIRDLCKALL